jgi:hypothetical protein
MTRQALEAYADASAVALAVPIPSEYRNGVINNLETIFAQSVRLMSLSLEPQDEAAPIFRADDVSRLG